MNRFDELFFTKYVPEGRELLFVCHRHVVCIIDHIFLVLFFAVFLPAFFYFNDSFGLRTLLPMWYFEGYLAAAYVYLVYSVFDWYNDVWLITDRGIIDVNWNFFADSVVYVDYHSIHGIEIRRSSIFDPLLGKGDIEVHLQDQDEEFRLTDAANPHGIVDYVSEVVERIRAAEHGGGEEPDDRKPFEILMETLTEMVREHLRTKGEFWTEEEEVAATETAKKVLRRKSTVDLSGE